MAEEIIGFGELFNFSDKSEIEKAERAIQELEKQYKTFSETLVQENKRIAKEQRAVTKTLREFQKQLQDADVTQKKGQETVAGLGNEVRKQTSEYKKLKQAQSDVNAAQKLYSDSVDGLKARIRELTKEYNSLSQSQNPQKVAELKKEIADLTGQTKNLAIATKKTNNEIKDAAGSYKALVRETRELEAKLKVLPNAFDKNNKAANALKKQIFENTQKLKDFDRQINHSFRNVGNYQSALNGAGGALKGFAFALVGAYIGIQGAANAARYIVDVNRDFEKSLSSLQSITGVTKEELKLYQAEALRIGKTTTTSAIQAVKAFQLIGSARPELLESRKDLIAVTEASLVLSEAAGIELPEAADALAGAFNQLQLPASEANRVINAMAAGSVAGAAEIKDLNDSLKGFGAVAQSTNTSIEESVALIEVLADRQIKGAEAGTALRNVLLKMSAVEVLPKSARAQLAKFGVDLKLVSDKTQPLNVRLREFSKIQADNNALVKVFGVENVVAGQIILKNIDRFEELTQKVTGTNTAYEQAAINTDNLDGSIKRLNAKVEAFTLSLSSDVGLGAALRYVIDLTASFIDSLTIKDRKTLLDTIPEKVDALKERYNLLVQDFVNGGATLEQASERATKQLSEDLQTQIDELKKNIKFREEEGIFSTVFEDQDELKKYEAETQREKDRLKIREAEISALKTFTTETKKAVEASEAETKAAAEKTEKLLENVRAYKDLLTQIQLQNRAAKAALISDEFAKAEAKLALDIDRATNEFSQKINDFKKAAKGAGTSENEIAFGVRLLNETLAAEVKRLQDEFFDQSIEFLIKVEADPNSTSEAANAFLREMYRQDLVALEDQRAQKLVTEEEYQRQREALEETFLLQQIESLKEEFGATEDVLQKELELYQRINDRKSEIDRESVEKRKQYEREIFDLSVGFVNELFARKNESFENEIAGLEKTKDKEIELAGNNAYAKEEIEKRFNERIEKTRKEQAEARRRQAIFEKAIAATDIIISTSKAVIASVAASPLTFGLPWSGFAAATGALQLATVLARPIPKYAVGTDNAPGGPAIVDERGAEIIESPDGKFSIGTNKGARLTHLEKGSKVYTASETKDFLNNIGMTYAELAKFSAANYTLQEIQEMSRRDADRIIDGVSTAIQNLPVHEHHEDERGVRHYTRYKNTRIQHLNARASFFGNG